MDLIVAGTSGRSILNWAPLLRDVKRRGGRSGVVLLDPAAATDTHWTEEERASWLHVVEANSKASLPSLIDAVMDFRADILLLANVEHGISLHIKNELRELPGAPIVVGAQHGFYQKWERYDDATNFDVFLLFGSTFRSHVDRDPRFIVAALPKIDAVRALQWPAETRRVLLAPQTNYCENIPKFVVSLHQQTGWTFSLRPHPMRPHLYDELLSHDFVRVDNRRDLNSVFPDVDCVVTTGSTIVLEALAARRPVIALPFQQGDVFADLGIVADFDGSSARDVLAKYRDAAFRDRLDAFLRDSTGSQSRDRTQIVYSTLFRLNRRRAAGRALVSGA